MDFLDQSFFQNTVKEWITAIFAALGVLAILKVIKGIVLKKLSAIVKNTGTEVDDFIVDSLGKTRSFFVLAVALYVGSMSLEIPAATGQIIRSVFVIAFLLQIGFWGNGLIAFWLNRSIKGRVAEDGGSATTMAALGFLGRLILWSVVLLVALDNVGVNITGLATGVGIGGIAIALAVQNVLGDLFASLSIVLDKPFVIGDFIIVGDFLGTVEHVGLKTTRLRSLSGEQVIFSNTDLLKSRIRNYKRMFERRVVFSIGIVYQTPPSKIEAASGILRSIIETEPVARFDRAHFKEFGDSALVYEIVYYVRSPDYNVYMDIQQRINLGIVRRFQKEEIEFAFPTRTLFVQNTTIEPVHVKSKTADRSSS